MLVTGIAGVAGYNAFHYFRRLYGDQVIGVRQPSMWPLQGDGIIACDVEIESEVRQLWQHHQFRSLINAAGSCKLKSCELDHAMAHRLNVLGSQNAIKCAAEFGARVIHLSIDLVFAGRDGGRYVEDDVPDPVTVYGAKMVEAEQIAADLVPDVCVLRISLPMGISFNAHAGAVDWIASRFRAGKPATLYYDEVRTPTYTDCLNLVLHRLIPDPPPGIFHAGGPRRLSLYEIAQVVCVAGGYDPHLLQGCPRVEAGPMPPRAGNVTLDSSKLSKLLGGDPFDPWPRDDRLTPLENDWHYKASQQIAGSESELHRQLYQNPARPGYVPPSRNQLWGAKRFR
tara:strand:- start:98430 stop:99449 length:1020 start_codon:yes stop_codon:yes gene_type:complete